MKFKPLYVISPAVVSGLMRIEAAKTKIADLPLTAGVLRSLRETARLYSTHYSTKIEGNRLTLEQVEDVLSRDKKVGRVRDEIEVKGYYAALTLVEQWVGSGKPLTEDLIQKLHAVVMSETIAKKTIKPSPYRDGQNVIYDGHTRHIVYMPPEAKDVPALMHSLIQWLIKQETMLPSPIVAALAHYQYVTIHPYYDGNGRTARLLATFVLHRGGYDLKGLYALEEYYARNLNAYYDALDRGPSHNYYMGRAEADLTPWVEYFVEGMAVACENVLKRMEIESGAVGKKERKELKDQEALLRTLDPKQRRALDLFKDFETATSRQIGELFGFKPRTSSQLCKNWVEAGFLEIVNPSNRNRSYRLSKQFEQLIAG